MKEYQSPSFVELHMNTGIGSYQDDFKRNREAPAFVVQAEEGEASPPAR